MRVGQQEKIYLGGHEAKVISVLLVNVLAALKHAAVNQYLLAVNPHQMTRASNATSRAVKREFHENPPQRANTCLADTIVFHYSRGRKTKALTIAIHQVTICLQLFRE